MANVSLFASVDGIAYNLVDTVTFDLSDRFQLVPTVMDISFDNLDLAARYIRVDASNGGRVPDGFPREESRTWLYFDELIVN